MTKINNCYSLNVGFLLHEINNNNNRVYDYTEAAHSTANTMRHRITRKENDSQNN